MTRAITCASCGAPTEHICRLCDTCIVGRVTAERTAQGLAPTITDPAAINLAAFHIRRARIEAAA